MTRNEIRKVVISTFRTEFKPGQKEIGLEYLKSYLSRFIPLFDIENIFKSAQRVFG